MNSLAHTSATTTTTTALGTPCQAPIPFEPFWDPNEASLDSIVADENDDIDALKSNCTALAAAKNDQEPMRQQRVASFEPFWDPNEASLDSLVDELDEAAAMRIALDFEMMFGNGQTEQKEQNEPDIATAAFELQAAAEAPIKTQRKARPYNSMFGKCQISARDMAAIEKHYHHDSKFGACQISLRDMAAIEEKEAQIAAAAAKAEAARAKIVADATEAAAAIEQQRALAQQKAAIDAALATEQAKIKVAAAAAAIAAAVAAAEAKMAEEEATFVAEAAVIEQQHAIAEAQAAIDAAAAILAKQQTEFAEAVIATAVAAAATVANVAFGACAAASAAYITEKANTRPVIIEQAKAHHEEKQHKHALKLKEKVMQPQRKQPQQQQQQQNGQKRGQQRQQNHVYCSSRFEIFTISEELEMHETFEDVALEVPAAPAATTAPIKAPAAPIKASRPHCRTAATAATAATGSCRLSCNRILNCNRTRVNANITTKNVVIVKLANVLAEARYLGAAVDPKLQSSARQPFVSAHSKVVKANANIVTNVVRVHAAQLAGKHVAPMIVNAARVAKARASMAFGSTTARFAAAAR